LKVVEKVISIEKREQQVAAGVGVSLDDDLLNNPPAS
jgi:hypothetical protein